MIIERIMFSGIGFLLAMLLALPIFPLVHTRAARLTKRQLEAGIPKSFFEILAIKDLQRAEFAMSIRRLELRLDQFISEKTAHLAEISRKADSINRLKRALAEATLNLAALEAKYASTPKELNTDHKKETVALGSQAAIMGSSAKKTAASELTAHTGNTKRRSAHRSKQKRKPRPSVACRISLRQARDSAADYRSIR